MADLGLIGKPPNMNQTPGGLLFRFPAYAVGGIAAALAQNKTISDRVLDANGAALANVVVTLFWRRTMVAIARTLSATDGSYSFTGLVPTSGVYVVLATPRDADTGYNEARLDRVTAS